MYACGRGVGGRVGGRVDWMAVTVHRCVWYERTDLGEHNHVTTRRTHMRIRMQVCTCRSLYALAPPHEKMILM